MNFKDLIGQRVMGITEIKDGNEGERFYMFLKDKTLKFSSTNQDYSWYSNWKIEECSAPESMGEYKSIGEKILEIWTDDYSLDTNDIEADMDKWIKAVGEGSWNAKEGEDYVFIKIKTKTKTIALGTVYYDCHYPDTIWDVI